MLEALAEFIGRGLVILIMVVGFMKLCGLFKGNPVVRGAVKEGLLSVLGRMFRK